MDVPALLGQAEGGGPLLGLEQVVVAAGGLSGEVAAVAAHALVDDEHAGVGAVLTDDVEGEAGALVGRGPGAQGLADRNHVVVDGLGQGDDVQPLLRQQVGCLVGPVAPQAQQAVQLHLLIVSLHGGHLVHLVLLHHTHQLEGGCAWFPGWSRLPSGCRKTHGAPSPASPR